MSTVGANVSDFNDHQSDHQIALPTWPKQKTFMPKMTIFETLRRCRALQKRRLPFLKSVVDFDLVTEIGYAQEQGTPLTVKQLFLADIGPAATVHRRLARLKMQGIVRQVRSNNDARVVQLMLDAAVMRKFGKFNTLASVPQRGPAGRSPQPLRTLAASPR